MVRGPEKGSDPLNRRVALFLVLGATSLTPARASAEELTERSAREVTYHGDVRAVLERHCVICHGKENLEDTETSGGLALDSPEAVLQSLKMDLVVVGKPDESQLLARLAEKDAERRMPKDDDPLPAETIDLVRRWIEQGAVLGEPNEEPMKRTRTRPRVFRDLVLPSEATPPEKFFGEIKPAAIELVAQVAPLAPVTALAFSSEGNLLAVGSFRRVLLWDLVGGQPPRVITDPIGMVNALAFTPSGETLWVAGGDPAVRGEILGYEVSSGSRIAEIRDAADVVAGISIRADGERLAAVGFDRHLRLYAIPKVEKVAEREAHSDAANGVAFSPDGTRIATAGKDRVIKIWDAETLESQLALGGHNQEILTVAFSGDGKTIYSSGLEPQIRIWDAVKGGSPSKVQGGQSGNIHQLAWNKDHAQLITGSSNASVFLWKPDLTRERALEGAGEAVFAVALGPNGKLAAAGTWNGFVRLWNPTNGKPLATLLSADRSDDQPPDWLAIARNGYFSCSPTLLERVHWRMSGSPLPSDRVAEILNKPAEVAKMFAGEEPAKVEFVPPPATSP